MKTYIYKTRKENLIKILDYHLPETEEGDLDNEMELLFILPGVGIEKVRYDLRPWQCLYDDSESFLYSEEILDYFKNEDYNKESIELEKISEGEAMDIINKYQEVYEILMGENILETDIPKSPYKNGLPEFLYRVDVLNYMIDIYGGPISSKIDTFINLSKRKKDFILGLGKISTRERKTKYINSQINELCGDDVEEVLQFLPEWYRLEYKVAGYNGELDTRDVPTTIEYNLPGNLGTDEIKLQKELYSKLQNKIYQTFNIGKTYSGTYIQATLRNIYSELGIKKHAKIKDIYDFFEYKKVNLRYHISEYKLITRKIV